MLGHCFLPFLGRLLNPYHHPLHVVSSSFYSNLTNESQEFLFLSCSVWYLRASAAEINGFLCKCLFGWLVCLFVAARVSWLLRKGSKCEASFAPNGSKPEDNTQNQNQTIHRTRTILVWLDACYNMNTNPWFFSALACPGAIKTHQVFPLWVGLPGESFIWLLCASLLLLRHVPRSVLCLIIHSKCFPPSFLISFGDGGLLVSHIITLTTKPFWFCSCIFFWGSLI